MFQVEEARGNYTTVRIKILLTTKFLGNRWRKAEVSLSLVIGHIFRNWNGILNDRNYERLMIG